VHLSIYPFRAVIGAYDTAPRSVAYEKPINVTPVA
jgi:hypothetical protein